MDRADAIIAYETVQLNSAVKLEITRFESFVKFFQEAEWMVSLSLHGMNSIQNLIFILGIFLISIVSATEISSGVSTVASFVGIITYFIQLQSPLSFFGTWYTMVQNNLVDAERMLELVSTQIVRSWRH